MTKIKKDTLKEKFSDGRKPTGEDFGNLIDSFVHQMGDEVHVDTNTRNVGIGVEAPRTKLDVDGSLSVSGEVGVGTSSPNEPLTIDGALSLKELSTSPGVSAGYGKLYVKQDKMVGARFNGESSYISMPSLDVDVRDFAVSVWFKCQRAAHNRHYIVDFRGDGSEVPNIGLVIDDQENGTASLEAFALWVGGSGATNYSHRENLGNIFDVWHHIVFTRLDGNLMIYFDGQKLSGNHLGEMKGDVVSWNNGWRVGAFCNNLSPGGEYWMFGSIDELGIWTRSLDDDAIRNIYMSGRSSNLADRHEEGLVCYLRLGDGADTSGDKTRDEVMPDRFGTLHSVEFHEEIQKSIHFKDGSGSDIVLTGGGSSFGGGGSLWGQSGQDLYYDGGNIGIGLQSPSATIHVY